AAWPPRPMNAMAGDGQPLPVDFPLREAIYRKAAVPVEVARHPLIDLAKTPQTRQDFLRAHALSPTAPTVAILPGSRPNEVARILPDLIAAADLIRARLPDVQFVVARAPNLDDRLFEVGGGRRP